jgi:DNA processing protein
MLKYFHAWNCVFEGLPRPFWNLLKHFSDLEYAWEKADFRELTSKCLKGPYELNFRNLKASGGPFRQFNDFAKNGIQTVSFRDRAYPAVLRNLNNHLPPPVLYIKGNIPTGYTYLSIVGTRAMTSYGEQVTSYLLKKLSAYKICIVSGLACGIDMTAHISAVNNGTPTIAVLGYGQYKTPFHLTNICRKIIENGALISEYPPHLQAQKYHFPLRNRIISGLSKATLVIEAGEKSGALITARYALDQGRDVMAIPGNIYQEKSIGTNRIIGEGSASLVANFSDILHVLGIDKKSDSLNRLASINQKSVFDALSKEPLSKGQLIKQTKLSPQEINVVLTELEIENYINKNRAGNYYITC